MALSDSMFLFEIVVEELKSYIDCKEFNVKSQFADVFTLILKHPKLIESNVFKYLKKKNPKRKTTVRNDTTNIEKIPLEARIQTGQSILFTSSVNLLISNMKKYPMEISLWNKDDPNYMMGSTHIFWNQLYIDFLNKIYENQDVPPVTVDGEYNVFDELSSKRMAAIKLRIKLSHLKDKIVTQFRSLSEDKEQTFIYTGFDAKPTTIFSTMKDNSEDLLKDNGTIKTIYGGRKEKNRSTKSKKKLKDDFKMNNSNNEIKTTPPSLNIKTNHEINRLYENIKSVVSHAKSEISTGYNKKIIPMKTKSSSSINAGHLNTLNYIFSDCNNIFGNKVYYVGYFTVENDMAKSPIKDSSRSSLKTINSEKSNGPKGRYKFRICDSECPSKKDENGACAQSVCSLDLPEETEHLINMTKCKHIECDNKAEKETPQPPDDRILLDLSSYKRQCCDVTKTEEVVGGIHAKMNVGDDPCFCSCECTFGFTKKTTYCSVCGGFEAVGEDSARTGIKLPFPCPIFHKLVDKNKLKTWSTSGSESKQKGGESQRSLKGSTKAGISDKRSGGDKKSVESEKDSKKGKKKNDRFKFNYGYKGIPPQIGHSQCALPCTGTLGAVPKTMGWLWTAENVPGMKFRPMWKPGAANKHVVRLLRIAKNPGEVIAKKRRKDTGKKKKSLKRPLLVVHKKDGEYTVTMETMKSYLRPRALNQAPFEEKLPLTYTIGRTDEENRERQKKKEREHRRLERAQRQFIQSAFKDVCRDICLKTYQQALGILPNTEDPNCPCYPAHPDADRVNVDVSCSCSEEKLSIGSDTDSDEWIVEFTPPSAAFDPTFKGKKIQKVENSSQYTYLDYRVKLVDRFGNPVPRFFKGPDGKQQISDLGGFWSPEHNWLEINIDGYIAPDGRWAPMSFIGPSGEQIDAETGKFQATNGKWLVVGVDGYVDSQGKWRFYPKPKGSSTQKKARPGIGKKVAGDKKKEKGAYKSSEATWSCFGDVSPKYLSKMGIVGHGQDRKLLLSTLNDMLAHGESVIIPQPSTVPRSPASKKSKKRQMASSKMYDYQDYLEKTKCKHPVPSDKGIIAVDAYGNKTYFRMKDYKNIRPNERFESLKDQGISLSSFHVPCFHSFINTEIMKQQQKERLMNVVAKSAKSIAVSTHIGDVMYLCPRT